MIEFPRKTAAPKDATDYDAWCEWTSGARRRCRANDLLDTFVDPIIADHMTIAGTKKSSKRSMETSEAYDSRRSETTRESTLSTSLKGESLKEEARKLLGASLKPVLPRLSATDALGMLKNRVRSKRKERGSVWSECFASYPNAEDVEKAIGGCAVSEVLRIWDAVSEAPLPENAQADHSPMDTDPKWPKIEDVAQALETFRVSSDVWKNCKVQTGSTFESLPSESPTVAGRLSMEPPAPESSPVSSLSLPEEPMRVSTSTILDEQKEIWRRIQLERLDNMVSLINTSYEDDDHETRRSVRKPVIRSLRASRQPPCSQQKTTISSIHPIESYRQLLLRNKTPLRSSPSSIYGPSPGKSVVSEVSKLPRRGHQAALNYRK